MTTKWDRQTDETEEWYDRFKVYLYMGPDRTVAAAHAFAGRVAKGAAHGQLGSWRRAAQRHQWKVRAAAFDAEVGRKTLARQVVLEAGAASAEAGDANSNQEGGKGDARLRMVAELLHQVYDVLRQADLRTLTREEARQLLPTLRLFFRDLLRIQQSEAAHSEGGGKPGTEWSAEDLTLFLTEMGGMKLLQADLSQALELPLPESSWRPLRDVLAQLYPDDASARRIASQAHLEGARIHFAARAVDSWHAILTEAAHAGRLEQIIQAAQQEYGVNAELAQAVRHYRQAQLEASGQTQIKQPVRRRRGRQKA